MKGEKFAARADLEYVACMLEKYRAIFGGYPASLDSLRTDLRLDFLPTKDPWGSKLHYEVGAKIVSSKSSTYSTAILASCGSDRQCGRMKQSLTRKDDIIIESGRWVAGARSSQFRDLQVKLHRSLNSIRVQISNKSSSSAEVRSCILEILGSGNWKKKNFRKIPKIEHEHKRIRLPLTRLAENESVTYMLPLEDDSSDTMVVATLDTRGQTELEENFTDNVDILLLND